MGTKLENTKINEDHQLEEETMKLYEENGAGRTDELRKEHFVLVHGVSHGAWCWYKIKTLMENSGHKASCIDLKGSGIDPTDPNSILEFDEYNQPLLDFLASLPDHDQVILVGHSAGGLSVTDASFKFPKKIKLVVYIAATMLRNGLATDQDVIDGVPDFSEYGEVYDYEFGLGSNQPPTSVLLKQDFLRRINYQMSPLEDCNLASMLVRPGPIKALTSARFNHEEGEEGDKVPRIYIKTKFDCSVKPSQQEAMVKKWAPTITYTLETDHSPFFSAPFLLFGLLIKATVSLH